MRKLAAFLLAIAVASPLLAQPVVSESKFVEIDHLKVHYTNYGKGETELATANAKSLVSRAWLD